MAIEILASVGAGLVASSLALLAFGGDSVVEFLSGAVVLAQLKGRGGSDGSSASKERITSALLFSLIPLIGIGAAYSYLTGLRPQGSPLGIAVATGAVAIMPYLYFEKRRIGRETGTLTLSMDAIESLTCFLMSIALLAGLLIEYLFGLWWVDYIATAAMLILVGKEALESFRALDDRRKYEFINLMHIFYHNTGIP